MKFKAQHKSMKGFLFFSRGSGKFECVTGKPEVFTSSIKSHTITQAQAQAQAEKKIFRDTSGCEYKLFLNGLEFNIPYQEKNHNYKYEVMKYFLDYIKYHNDSAEENNKQHDVEKKITRKLYRLGSLQHKKAPDYVSCSVDNPRDHYSA
ncbi:hypothetical protein [Iodobacter sp. BJB302]|uniref:hypothetical protein n=1 Tax=Iodobacter sp. BJB302 TaxID=1506510 RepID=UPI000C11AADF|nr:hypothetical protein [Iodobacter sp. BJB302]PHU99593.1 hypothetical protein CSQ88_21660 [Iodobacter sp. BJB302]